MLNSYHSNYYWNKAERLMREEPTKSKRKKKKFYFRVKIFFFFFHLEFAEQLLRQNQKRSLTRDGPTLDFLLYIFYAIDLLRLTNA
jgi:hypothetical protein